MSLSFSSLPGMPLTEYAEQNRSVFPLKNVVSSNGEVLTLPYPVEAAVLEVKVFCIKNLAELELGLFILC